MYVTRKKKENPFWFCSLGKQVQFCTTLKFCRAYGRTIVVTSVVSKKNWQKADLTIVDSFLRLKIDEKSYGAVKPVGLFHILKKNY